MIIRTWARCALSPPEPVRFRVESGGLRLEGWGLKVEGPGLNFQVSGVRFLNLTDVRLGQIKPKTRNSASGAGRSGVAGSVHPRLHNLIIRTDVRILWSVAKGSVHG